MNKMRRFFRKLSFPTASEVAAKANESLPPFLGSAFNRKLLFVEDDLEIRMVMREIIKKYACEMVEAADGKAALIHFEPRKYDLILLDVRLPDMSGIEILRTIRWQDPLQPVAVFSGYLDSATIDEIYAAGWAFLGRKPDDLRDGNVLRLMLRTAGIIPKPEFL